MDDSHRRPGPASTSKAHPETGLDWSVGGDDRSGPWATATGGAQLSAGAVDGDGSGEDGDADIGLIDGSDRRRVRRWAGRLAVIALLVALGVAGARALRADRLHRAIRRDVQHVVRLEAEALSDGDREIYLGLQDEGRRRALRRPDRAAEERDAVGPFPGLLYADGAPSVDDVEVAAKDAAHAVTAVTATVSVHATDGARVGRFVQARRMVRGADGRWLHGSVPSADASDALETYAGTWIIATMPTADATLLRPALATADALAKRYCDAFERCTEGAARLSFARTEPVSGPDVVRLRPPSASWRPADAAARDLLAFALARAAILTLDEGFAPTLESGGFGHSAGLPTRPWALLTALVDAWIMADTDPSGLEAWLSDPTARERGLSLWTLEPRRLERGPVEPQDLMRATRGFAAFVHDADPTALRRLLVDWPERIAEPDTRWRWLSRPSLEAAFGARALELVRDWPDPQRPSGLDRSAVLWCTEPGGNGAQPYLIAPGGTARNVATLACGDAVATSFAWSPEGSLLALACFERPTEGGAPHTLSLALVAPDAAAEGGWRVARTPVTDWPGTAATHPAWSPDGRRIAWHVLAPYDLALEEDRPYASEVGVWTTAVTTGAAPSLAPPARAFVTGAYNIYEALPDGPTWSPDGRSLSARNGDRAITVHAVADDSNRTLPALLHAWSPDGRRIARVIAAGPSAEAAADEAGGAGNGSAGGAPSTHSFELSVVDAETFASVAHHNLTTDDLAMAVTALGRPVELRANALPIALSWSDDGAWVAATFTLRNTRCGDASDCVVALAWEPATDDVGAVLNAPQGGLGGERTEWRSGWLPGTHDLAVFAVGAVDAAGGPYMTVDGDRRPRGDVGETIAFVLDADAGTVSPLPNARIARLATLLPTYSPDGAWHVRPDAGARLVFEPTAGVGGYTDGDPATGWRFNQPFCGPRVLWGPAAGR